MKNNVDFLGKGISLNFGVNTNGGIRFSSYEKSVEESIDIILSTRIGERVYNYKFGCKIHDLMFEPNNIRTQALAARYVKEALENFEHRITIIDVNAFNENEKSLNININYILIASNKKYNLVYPFYLLPV